MSFKLLIYSALLVLEQNSPLKSGSHPSLQRCNSDHVHIARVYFTPKEDKFWYGAGGRDGKMKDWRIWLSKVLEKTASNTLVYDGKGIARDLVAKVSQLLYYVF